MLPLILAVACAAPVDVPMTGQVVQAQHLELLDGTTVDLTRGTVVLEFIRSADW